MSIPTDKQHVRLLKGMVAMTSMLTDSIRQLQQLKQHHQQHNSFSPGCHAIASAAIFCTDNKHPIVPLQCCLVPLRRQRKDAVWQDKTELDVLALLLCKIIGYTDGKGSICSMHTAIFLYLTKVATRLHKALARAALKLRQLMINQINSYASSFVSLSLSRTHTHAHKRRHI